MLAILVLLMVFVLAITSVIHVETRTSASGRDLLLARQNALLGLDIAIGQLQEYAGKDQAVTFPATTYYPTKDVTTGTGSLFDDATFGYRAKAVTAKGNSTFTSTYLTPSERTQWDNALKDWWNASRNPRWTGIMDASLRVDRASRPNASSANATPLAAQRYENNPATKFGEPKRDQLPVWLVSGNEKFTIDQENDTAYPQGYFTPDTALPDPDADPSVVWIVGEGSSTRSGNSTDGLDGWVKVKKQEVIAPAAGGNTTLTGHYAYWVGDEATKANFAARDRTSQNDDTYPNDLASTASKEYRNRLQVPQRIGWENISISGNATTRFQDVATFSPNDPYLENISTSKEIGLLQATKGDDAKTQQIKDAAKNNFHALTAFSKSLLTDTALGGLKKDLTVFLEGTGGPSGNSTIMDASRYLQTTNSDPVNDPRLGGNNTGFPATTTNLPVWQDVKTWQDAMGDGGGQVPVTKGMAPVFANFQIFFAITHDADKLQFHMIPMIALWNPYDASLASTTYTLQWRHNFGMRPFTIAVLNPDCPPTAYTTTASGQRKETNAGTKLGNFFITPFQRIGYQNPSESQWFLASTKYRPSSFAEDNYENFPNYWTNPTPDPWGGMFPAGPYGNSYFSPFDKKATTGVGDVPMPINSDGSASGATWVNYEFTAEFAPGEVKVFTVLGMQKVDPAALHGNNGTDGVKVQMANSFDPNRPTSFYFDFVKNLQRNPNQLAGTGATGSWPASPGDPITNADEVRWFGGYNDGPHIGASIRLMSGSTTLWTNYFSGDSISNNSYNTNFQVATAADPSTWRIAYPLDAWPGSFDLTTDTRVKDSPIVGFFRSSMDAFRSDPTLWNNSLAYTAESIYPYRAFASGGSMFP